MCEVTHSALTLFWCFWHLGVPLSDGFLEQTKPSATGSGSVQNR
jgi:hypothetical protein